MMGVRDALLAEYDHEMGTTRRLLERVTDATLAWRPHHKSMSLERLASHLVEIPTWVDQIMNATELDIARLPVPAPSQWTRARILETFDKNVASARAILAQKEEGEYFVPWTLTQLGNELFTLPRLACLRSFLMNHIVHHRGQLSVYLRLNDIPVPSIYGPSADEQG